VTNGGNENDELSDRGSEFPPVYHPTPEEARARRRRNIAIALAIGAFTLLFYAITVAKLGVGVIKKGL